ncbi:MAG: restriction endonuclease [Candidatus Harrisonbacteria bacterium RIFCSPLOWO2_02_FULL_41_11]|uniref:Restriction endonuclease n=1 Tax=Candidatus Harrisonbacteria bacterium RIFCSPHIGHO2_02_FULL_42_16 TaxID=1798404 RepID=A0A1G1ZFT0_9BACT|nr:MAG: restriction endonuclease [Candidatus Harrisonbacteria bacterium RIFCSPHIGHO2_02_FULL_42_16]OGY65591.1 MAG: restriction endonuclease [Candidatus Harrisonbacteria bacterium RIFCSPLOWO2_02_FULL_41_11]
MIIKIKNEELVRELIGEVKNFPKYTTQIINLANQNAQGTRPRVVGQLSELIQECPEKTYIGWKKWYLSKHPKAIENATEKITEMIDNLEKALKKIDKSMIKRWAEDLILEKTFVGLRFQEAILKKVAGIKNVDYRLAERAEESKGIDGLIGKTPVSIKPITYKLKKSLREEIRHKIIFYSKTKTGLEIDASEVLK